MTERIAMRLWALAALLAVTTVLPVIAAEPDFIQARSWRFMVDRGGLSIGDPVQVGGHYKLPVTCDVSGTRTITRRSTVMHAGLAWWRSDARVDGSRIELTILTAEQGPNAPTTRCGAADLAHIDAGRYRVVYRDPDGTTHPLGDVTIP